MAPTRSIAASASRAASWPMLPAAACPSPRNFFDTTLGQYYADLVSWGAIGARTVESQIHRRARLRSLDARRFQEPHRRRYPGCRRCHPFCAPSALVPLAHPRRRSRRHGHYRQRPHAPRPPRRLAGAQLRRRRYPRRRRPPRKEPTPAARNGRLLPRQQRQRPRAPTSASLPASPRRSPRANARSPR